MSSSQGVPGRIFPRVSPQCFVRLSAAEQYVMCMGAGLFSLCSSVISAEPGRLEPSSCKHRVRVADACI